MNNEDIESLARAWTGFDRLNARSNYEELTDGPANNKMDPMYITPEARDPFPKSNLNGGFIGDGYVLCKDLPAQSFLKKDAGYRLLGGKDSPFFEDDENRILRVELEPSSALYQRLHNGGDYELFVKLENDIPCTPGTVECSVDTLCVVKLGSIFYEFVERPYNNGKQIQQYNDNRRGQMCANPGLSHAHEACCREELNAEVRTATMEANVTYFYEGERMRYSTARDRCVAYGQDLCLFRAIQITPNNEDARKGYHWTNKDCSISVKVNSKGYIAIVHDASISNSDTIPWHLEEDNTQNWFRVFWNNGSYPGDSETNTCEDNGCKTRSDGDCLCRTSVSESVMFTDIVNVSKEDVMSQLFLGVLGPQQGSAPTNITDDLTVHMIRGNLDSNTVFEVQDMGRTLYLKNTLSTVRVEGWTMPPQIYEAEDAISNAPIITDTSSATGGSYVDARGGDQTTFVEWTVNVTNAGKYLLSLSLRYASNADLRPLSVFVNEQEVLRPAANPNPIVGVTNLGLNFDTYPIGRCQADCNRDDQCNFGLFCYERNGDEAVPGCSGGAVTGWDYCVDISDFNFGFVLLPTGGWFDNWCYSDPLEVDLIGKRERRSDGYWRPA
mmetsp:Transcript_30664/g.64801  ORF Transcript_30664/g.64801 Transcript_30664/m.64801 type:complete len:611 (+) Transcript_30664:516-2348(+)